MRPFKSFSRENVYKEIERLPVGGYVLKILDVKYVENQWGNQIVLSFDILEGEQKDFFRKNYAAQTGEDKKWKGTYRLNVPKDDGSEQDQWTQKRFNTVIVNFEESNPGFYWDWDEQKLKSKIIGALFNNKEYEFNGRHGFFTNCYSLVPVELIRSGKYQIPEDTLLKTSANTPAATGTVDSHGFMNIPDGVNDDYLPFNN